MLSFLAGLLFPCVKKLLGLWSEIRSCHEIKDCPGMFAGDSQKFMLAEISRYTSSQVMCLATTFVSPHT